PSSHASNPLGMSVPRCGMGSQPPEPVVDEDSPAEEASLSETSPAVDDVDVPDSGAVPDPGAAVDATIVVDPDDAVERPSDPEFEASPPSSGVPTQAVNPRATRIEFLSVRVCIPSVYPECPRQTRRRLAARGESPTNENTALEAHG